MWVIHTGLVWVGLGWVGLRWGVCAKCDMAAFVLAAATAFVTAAAAVTVFTAAAVTVFAAVAVTAFVSAACGYFGVLSQCFWSRLSSSSLSASCACFVRSGFW